MIDIKFVRENLEEVKKNVAKRGKHFDFDNLLKLDEERKSLQARIEMLRSEQNKLAKTGFSKETTISDETREKAIEIKTMLKDLEPQLQEAEEAFFNAQAYFPNMIDESVPTKEEGDRVEKSWGEIPKFNFAIKDHLEIGEKLDLIDMERASRISGARFYFLKNELVLLEFALIQYISQKLVQKGFTPMITPDLVKQEAMYGTGFFPADKNEIYRINYDEDDLYLIGTAEVPLASYHADETFKEEDLPKKYFGFSTCFRREAGSYGRDTRGIIRVHQFDKVEMFVYSKPEDSWKIFEELRQINEEVFQELKLPYHQININAGELGQPNAKKIDTEVWIPSQNTYRELTSCSNDTDFQARRLNTKYVNKEGKKEFVHTQNDTALAMARVLVAILENYQQEDGSVVVPEVLQKYTNFKVIKR